MSSLSAPAATLSGSPDRAQVAARRRWTLIAVYAALAVVALYPVFSVTVPALVDYPNHLARMHILAHWESVPALQQNYVINWTLIPNMAMELTVPLLAQVMPIYMAGKVFVAATLLMLLGGTIAVRKAIHGRVGLWPVLAFLLLYNHALFWGFLNYLFAAGLSLLIFSAWITLRQWSWRRRAALFAPCVVVLYMCHLFGLMIFGVLVLGYELWRMRNTVATTAERRNDWLAAAIPFLAPGILFLAWTAENASAVSGQTDFGALEDRAVIFFAPVHFNLTVADIGTMMFLGLAWIVARSGRTVGIAPPLKLPLILLSLLALAMPIYLNGVWGTHVRFPVVIGCLLIAGTQFRESESRRLSVLIAAAAVLFVARAVLVADQWRDLDTKFQEFRLAAAAIEPGARLLSTLDEADLPPESPPLYAMQFWHMNALAVIERGAFVPTLFTGHTAISAATSQMQIDTPVGNPLPRQLLALGFDAKASPVPLGHHLDRYVRAYWIDWPNHYDYLLTIRFANTAPLYPDRVSPATAGSFFDIGRIR